MTYTGKWVANYIEDITPNENDIPTFWINKYVLPNDGWTLEVINIKDLLDSDSDFKDYISDSLEDPDYHRYYFSDPDGYYLDDQGNPAPEVTRDDIHDNPIVVFKGKVIDGFSRAYEILLEGVDTIEAYIFK